MLILRKEKFGGIIFNSDNANELWLNKKLFNRAVNALQTKKYKTNNEIKKVFNELEAKNFNFRIFNKIKKIENNFSFNILNSPNLADINITNKCNLNCPHCYIDSNSNQKEMSWSDFRLAIDECAKAGIFQAAIGGGEPTLHPLFNKFLKEARKRDIVPNITTNGKELKWKTIYAMAKYAGAVALSIEEIGKKFEERRGFAFKDFLKSVKKIKAAKINLVFQIVISKNNLSTVSRTINEIVTYNPYGILFLAYKPQGRGKKYDAPLSQANQTEVKNVFKNIFRDLSGKTKIGFDCCLTPALIDIKNSSCFQGCSASRTSIAIMPDLNVLPCSFLNNSSEYGNLKNKTLPDIWQGKKINAFRGQIARKMNKSVCKKCLQKDICLGGCPIFNLTNCDKLC